MDLKFTELPVSEGIGDFHVNQFRIHFSIPGFKGDVDKRVQLLVAEFMEKFPVFFNGEGTNLKKNVAEVQWSDKFFGENKTLRFLLDLRAESLGLNLPDAHDDWVSIVWADASKGFAAQTLKRNFPEALDLALIGLPPPLIPILHSYNSYHFLAGRRSWVFGVVAPGLPGWKSNGVQVGRIKDGQFVRHPGAAEPVFFLETSAVERSSALLYALVEKDVGFILDMRKAIVSTWNVLLVNYVRSKGFRLNVGHPITYQFDDGSALWDTRPDWRGVYFRQSSFASPDALYAKKWVNNLLELHPALKGQSLGRGTVKSGFKGFGGGRFGGGGLVLVGRD